jgi:hypothetical protein
MVTVSPLTEHDPVAVITGVLLEFDDADTVNVDWYGALLGSPEMLPTVFIAAATVVVSVTPVAAE